MADKETTRRRAEQIASMALLLLLVLGCLMVLLPFLTSILWAAILAYASWPVFTWAEAKLKGRTALASGLMTLLLAAALVMPLVLLGVGLVSNATPLVEGITRMLNEGIPAPPAWVKDIPLLGTYVEVHWSNWAADQTSLMADLKKYLGTLPLKEWLLALSGATVSGALHIALSVVISYFFYRDGLAIAAQVQAIGQRVAGEYAVRLLDVAAGTVRSVVGGILGTAAVQGLLAVIGFWIAGVPSALLLGLATFFVSLIPFGPPLIWIPAAFWLYHIGETGWAIFMVAWGLLVISGVDNFVKPYLITRGGSLPLLLVFLGVFGGVIAFGFIGIFLGPVILAVAYNLLNEWLRPQNN